MLRRNGVFCRGRGRGDGSPAFPPVRGSPGSVLMGDFPGGGGARVSCRRMSVAGVARFSSGGGFRPERHFPGDSARGGYQNYPDGAKTCRKMFLRRFPGRFPTVSVVRPVAVGAFRGDLLLPQPGRFLWCGSRRRVDGGCFLLVIFGFKLGCPCFHRGRMGRLPCIFRSRVLGMRRSRGMGLRRSCRLSGIGVCSRLVSGYHRFCPFRAIGRTGRCRAPAETSIVRPGPAAVGRACRLRVPS